jgi:hypothetical protein
MYLIINIYASNANLGVGTSHASFCKHTHHVFIITVLCVRARAHMVCISVNAVSSSLPLCFFLHAETVCSPAG